jgi:hypothetical protein
VHRQFVYACPVTYSVSRQSKSIFRRPELFGAFHEHSPCRFDAEKAGKPFGSPGLIWVNNEGKRVPKWDAGDKQLGGLSAKFTSHKVAQINHYMVRSEESFSLKRGTPSPVRGSDRYIDIYLERANSGDDLDSTAFGYAERFDAMHARAMALPDVARLHALCCADHVKAICEKAGRRAEDDPRYAAFLAQAEGLAQAALQAQALREQAAQEQAAAYENGAAGSPAAPLDSEIL